jgi:hypothetical protein
MTVLNSAPPPGPVQAWKSTLCAKELLSWLRSVTSIVSPTRARTIGPGTVPLKVQNWNLVL